MSDWLDGVTNPFLRLHLEYVENTESPRVMHLWAAIASASAAMGRHLWLDTGIGPLYPNLYVLLVGPPGTRKSSAINFASNIMEDATAVKTSPDDTSGQRKGLIRALTNTNLNGVDNEQMFFATGSGLDVAQQLGEINLGAASSDQFCLFIKASEFGSFLGHNSLDLTRFLIKLWDCEPYKYQISEETLTIPDTCAVMLGGTTATDMATILPPEAMGQGFMSRIVLVSAQEKEKAIDEPTLKDDLVQYLAHIYGRIATDMRGPITRSTGARNLLKFYYHRPIEMEDHRFMYYAERRHTHLQKTASVLTVTSDTLIMEEAHVQEANLILEEAEKNMPDALGEYGLSPVAAARQKMLEYLVHQKEPVADSQLWAIMQRDMRLVDFRNSINTLKNAGKILAVNTQSGPAYVVKSNTAAAMKIMEPKQLDTMFGALQNPPQTRH